MRKIKALTILNTDKIRDSEFINLIPEIYELKNIVENNPGHQNDSVFNHTISVLERLEDLLKTVNDKISNYLNQKIANYTRKDLLLLAALFHDIAKKETIIEKNGITSCPGHEEQGALKIKKILSRFDLAEDEKDLIIQTIKYHGIPYLIVRPDNNKIYEEFANFKQKYPNIFLELVLLDIADILGSQLGESKPEEFEFRINFIKKILNEY